MMGCCLGAWVAMYALPGQFYFAVGFGSRDGMIVLMGWLSVHLVAAFWMQILSGNWLLGWMAVLIVEAVVL